ncbi:Iron-sulfur flavoprotein [Neomoorella glycerini]|uniref:Iron-sulfur flavoprotein n=1 Tax=Neomoorella glycerini TaxID=55779 RepID=A0A6I5ZNG9_9FIRM|nr:flavodoxin family protein [Moorella glycerini]QGP91147.1 Iron-sulfur flavoprotein [Moorella glycerini]
MKIFALCGSPRKNNSRTAQLLKQVLAGAQLEGAETEYVDLSESKINYCFGCGKCHKLGECIQKDSFNSLFGEILQAEGIILGSPVYAGHITAQLKTWFDRLANAIHCQRLAGKYGMVISTANGSGHEDAANYMEKVLRRIGVQVVDRMACTIPGGLLPEEAELLSRARDLGVTLARAIAEKREFPEQLEEQERLRNHYRQVILRNKDVWEWEYRYIQEKGWL